MASNTVNVYTPNMRFGASFLDYLHHEDMCAVNDEIMLDKRTGQLVYKRNTDGKLVYWSQENFHLNNYMRQLSVLIKTNIKTYVRPTLEKCVYYRDAYFMSYNIDTVDWRFNEAGAQTFLEGGVLCNNHPDDHSFVQETNGFFFQAYGRPRDRALLSYLTALYDDYYSNYDGEDEDALAKKAMYEDNEGYPGWDMSNVCVNYTVTWYDSTDAVVNTVTANGYVRANEISFVPFSYLNIYDRIRVVRATFRINSISTPKIKDAIELLNDDTRKELYDALKDNPDFGFISCNVSIFVCAKDPDFTLPNLENSVILLLMGEEEFEKELVRAKEALNGGAAASGIVIDVYEPDSDTWDDTIVWEEILRRVASDGSVVETDHRTDISSIEKGLATVDYEDANLGEKPEDLWIKKLGKMNIPATTQWPDNTGDNPPVNTDYVLSDDTEDETS
jgi:hypothetical protein